MLLVDCDIQEFVKDHIKLFLTKKPLTFAELKAFLVSKAPIPFVHNQCVEFLTVKKSKDLDSLKCKLSEQAYKKQENEDETLRKRLNQEEQDDKANSTAFKRQCKTIRTQIETYQCEIEALQMKLLQQVGTPLFYTHKTGSTDDTEQKQAMDLIHSSLIKYRTKIRQQEVLLKSKENELT
ncbi:MAG: hypothetical protein EPN84_09260, partial [Legionella sp.]